MPKIIENLRDRLLRETALQVRNYGYAAVTVRSVATACNIAVGTVYNYFPSKDDMIAAFMLDDWVSRISAIRETAADSASAEPVLRVLYSELSAYAADHAFLFDDPAAFPGYSGFSRHYHSVLRKQLAEPLRKYCANDFASEFIAEAMLTWTMAKKDFEEIFSLVQRLLDKGE